MDNDTNFTKLVTDVFLVLVAVAISATISATISYDNGYNAGARAHADGKVVVVDLPDGTRVVVKPKEIP